MHQSSRQVSFSGWCPLNVRCAKADSQRKPAKEWTLMDNASNLLTSLLSGGSIGSMPIAEGAVSDLFGKPLFFALYDWFLEVKPFSFALFLSLQFHHNPCTSAFCLSASKPEIQRSPFKFLFFSESQKLAAISYVCMQHGPVYKLAFGPKAFVVVSDPIVARHILRENAFGYDKGVLADILEPIMGKGLIPADLETWKVRRRGLLPFTITMMY
jgi:hypothetical protein